MTLSDLASIGSLVSGIAVLISLIYLSLQVKQAEKNQRALMQQGRANRISENCFKLAEQGLSSIYSRGMSGDETLTAEQLTQFMLMIRGALISAEDSFLHNSAGLLDPSAFNSFVAGIRHFFTLAGLRAAWRLSAPQFGEEFASFMNGMMDEIQIAPKSDPLALWNATVKAENGNQEVR
jgi:hypothetical protein